MARKTELERILQEYVEGVKQFYPAIRYSGRSSIYSGELPSSAHLDLGHDKPLLHGTTHLLGRVPIELVHFTSLQSAINIIEYGELWLSQVGRCNDAKELNHAFSSVNKSESHDLDAFKRKYFITSFCKNKLSEEEEFMMWRYYGRDGYGLALVFEVEKPNTNISSYVLGRVIYGEKNKAFEAFRQFQKFDSDFRQKHPHTIQNRYFHEILMLGLLLKTSIWKKEKEVRLIGFHDFDQYTLKTKTYNFRNSFLSSIKHTVDEAGNHRAYLRLPLFGSAQFMDFESRLRNIDPQYDFRKMLPQLKLKEVVVGYRISKNYVPDLDAVLTTNSSSLATGLKIRFSRLCKYF